jgi:hypothetical protein
MRSDVEQMRSRIAAFESPCEESRPARPATCGAAIDVPLQYAYVLPIMLE